MGEISTIGWGVIAFLGALTYTVKTLAGMNREQRAVATEEFVQERSIA